MEEIIGFEMFGVPIHFYDGMVRLRDIQLAYCVQSGRTEESTQPHEWSRTLDAVALTKYLKDIHLGDPDGLVDRMPGGRSGGRYVCTELAHHYAMWLDVRYFHHVLRAFNALVMQDSTLAREYAENASKVVLGSSWDSLVLKLQGEAGNQLIIEDILCDRLNLLPKEAFSIELIKDLMNEPDAFSIMMDMIRSYETACIAEAPDAEDIVWDQYEGDRRLDVLRTYVIEQLDC